MHGSHAYVVFVDAFGSRRSWLTAMAVSQERYWYVEVCLGRQTRGGKPRWSRHGPEFHDEVLVFAYARRLLERYPPPHDGPTPDTVRVIQRWRRGGLRTTL